MATRQQQHAAGFPRRTTAAGCVLVALGSVMPEQLGQLDRVLLVVGLAMLVGGLAVYYRARLGSAGMVGRWERRGRRNAGMASWLGLFVLTSKLAMFRAATVMRPSLAELSTWARWRLPVTDYAVELVKVGRRRVYSSPRDVTLRVGGPGTGKSVELLPKIVDAPGAVIVTSTRTDLLDSAAPARMAKYGSAAQVFNPSGVAGIPSSVKFSPLHGCRVAETAHARADDMVGSRSGSGDAERWDTHARRILAILLHAAAIADEDMFAVQRWAADPLTFEQQVTKALLKSRSAQSFVADWKLFLGTNDRTRTSITSTMSPALAWLMSEKAVAATQAGGEPFDVADLIRTRGQVYVLGAQEGLVSPLMGAFTGYVAREARRLARLQPGGRLDPWLTLALDEAALVPVPLPDWTADMGGSGIAIHIAVQGRSQLERTWGHEGGATIINNSGSVLVFGGVRDPSDLDAWSKLSGERHDEEGRLVPVLSPAGVSQLPAWRALVIQRGLPASIGRVPKSWKRRDIRKAKSAAGGPEPMETRYADLEDPEGLTDV